MKTFRLALLFVFSVLLTSGCGVTEYFFPSPTPTPTVTPSITPTSTITPSPTPTPTDTPVPPTPTITPVPIKLGSWKGVADGWDPPLTISFNVTNEGDAYRVTDMVIFIPEIDLGKFISTLVHTRCTVKLDPLDVMENGFSYPADGDVKVFEAQFTGPATVTAKLYDGWMCDNQLVKLGAFGSLEKGAHIPWHAEWKE